MNAQVNVQVDVQAVPEPTTTALWLAGLLALAHLRRRRGAQRQPRWNGLPRMH